MPTSAGLFLLRLDYGSSAGKSAYTHAAKNHNDEKKAVLSNMAGTGVLISFPMQRRALTPCLFLLKSNLMRVLMTIMVIMAGGFAEAAGKQDRTQLPVTPFPRIKVDGGPRDGAYEKGHGEKVEPKKTTIRRMKPALSPVEIHAAVYTVLDEKGFLDRIKRRVEVVAGSGLCAADAIAIQTPEYKEQAAGRVLLRDVVIPFWQEQLKKDTALYKRFQAYLYRADKDTATNTVEKRLAVYRGLATGASASSLDNIDVALIAACTATVVIYQNESAVHKNGMNIIVIGQGNPDPRYLTMERFIREPAEAGSTYLRYSRKGHEGHFDPLVPYSFRQRPEDYRRLESELLHGGSTIQELVERKDTFAEVANAYSASDLQQLNELLDSEIKRLEQQEQPVHPLARVSSETSKGPVSVKTARHKKKEQKVKQTKRWESDQQAEEDKKKREAKERREREERQYRLEQAELKRRKVAQGAQGVGAPVQDELTPAALVSGTSAAKREGTARSENKKQKQKKKTQTKTSSPRPSGAASPTLNHSSPVSSLPAAVSEPEPEPEPEPETEQESQPMEVVTEPQTQPQPQPQPALDVAGETRELLKTIPVDASDKEPDTKPGATLLAEAADQEMDEAQQQPKKPKGKKKKSRSKKKGTNEGPRTEGSRMEELPMDVASGDNPPRE